MHLFVYSGAPRSQWDTAYISATSGRGMFIAIQTLLNEAFLNLKADALNKTRLDTAVAIGRKMPYPAYRTAIVTLTQFVPFVVGN